jgi:homeobox-leucine zipper protein
MELGLSLGEPDAGRAAPELRLGLGLAAAAAGRDEGGTTGSGSRAAGNGAGARWWAAPVDEPEPDVRLSLVSSLGIQWPPPPDSGAGE